MKYYLLIALLAIGCKANLSEPATAANAPKETPGEGRPVNHPEETPGAGKPTFTQCTEAAGHFVWDESKKAYNYVTSEEAKKFYHNSWEATKQTANGLYDDAVKAYHENVDPDKDEEKKTDSDKK